MSGLCQVHVPPDVQIDHWSLNLMHDQLPAVFEVYGAMSHDWLGDMTMWQLQVSWCQSNHGFSQFPTDR